MPFLWEGEGEEHKELSVFHFALEESLCKHPEIAIPPSQCL